MVLQITKVVLYLHHRVQKRYKYSLFSVIIAQLCMEKVYSIACFCLGTIFLAVALFGLWNHLITMGVCYAVGFLAKEDKITE